MRTAFLVALLFTLALPTQAADTAAEASLAAVTDLGQINGRALACGEKDTSAQTKNLMLRYAPRTSSYGDAFEQATQQGFLAQVKGQEPCPDTRAFAANVDAIAKRIRASLPPIEAK